MPLPLLMQWVLLLLLLLPLLPLPLPRSSIPPLLPSVTSSVLAPISVTRHSTVSSAGGQGVTTCPFLHLSSLLSLDLMERLEHHSLKVHSGKTITRHRYKLHRLVLGRTATKNMAVCFLFHLKNPHSRIFMTSRYALEKYSLGDSWSPIAATAKASIRSSRMVGRIPCEDHSSCLVLDAGS